jgi:hypothetical protein
MGQLCIGANTRLCYTTATCFRIVSWASTYQIPVFFVLPWLNCLNKPVSEKPRDFSPTKLDGANLDSGLLGASTKNTAITSSEHGAVDLSPSCACQNEPLTRMKHRRATYLQQHLSGDQLTIYLWVNFSGRWKHSHSPAFYTHGEDTGLKIRGFQVIGSTA